MIQRAQTVVAVFVLWLAASCGGASQGPDAVGDAPGPHPDIYDNFVPDKDWRQPEDGECKLPDGDAPDFAKELGCIADFQKMAQRPPTAAVPGALSLKTVVDTADNDALYFLNATKYPWHYEFCFEHLNGNGLPPVQLTAGEFSVVEYFSPYRRFYLGAVTWYENPGVWTYEIAPYDTSSAEMVTAAYDYIREASFLGDALYFHPTSDNIEEYVVGKLPEHVKVITNAELFAGIDYLPLNLGVGVGQLRFLHVADLESGEEFVTPRDIVVLDRVPNDISVVAGIITAEPQTPLSHVNVLSQNRGTPNMSLKGAMDDADLLAVENKWVKLTVDPFVYTVVQISKEEADEWWEEHKPPAVQVPKLDLEEKDLTNCDEIDIDRIPAFGGKASHYGVLTGIEGLNVPKAFAIPVYYYKQFEQQNGVDAALDELLSDPKFQEDISYREEKLKALRDEIIESVLDADFLAEVLARLDEEYPGIPMRFRSSTNAEDLNGFTGAGLYTSKTGNPNDPDKPVDIAIKKVYASLWNHRAFEERSYRGIDHKAVAMALLVHRSFPSEDASGVGLTANMFSDAENAFYVNVQAGDVSVVLPPAGVTADSFLYFFTYPNQPMIFFSHSNLVPEGETVLTKSQTSDLGAALEKIHQGFYDYYGLQDKNEDGEIDFYAMDVEFKFNTEPGDEESVLWMKQARPHPGWEVGLGN